MFGLEKKLQNLSDSLANLERARRDDSNRLSFLKDDFKFHLQTRHKVRDVNGVEMTLQEAVQYLIEYLNLEYVPPPSETKGSLKEKPR